METTSPTITQADPERFIALSEFGIALASTLDEREMAKALVRVVTTLFSTELVAALFRESAHSSLSVTAVQLEGKALQAEREKLLSAAQAKLDGADFQMEKWVSYLDVELADDPEVKQLTTIGLRSLVLVPITHSGLCLGVLALGESNLREFSSSECLTLLWLSKLAEPSARPG